MNKCLKSEGKPIDAFAGFDRKAPQWFVDPNNPNLNRYQRRMVKAAQRKKGAI